MNRSLKLFAALVPISLLCALHGTAGNPQMNSAYDIHRQRAVHMNELAGKIQSLGDSRRLDMIAEMFVDELPPAWGTSTILDRVANAEYESATDPARLIPEQRIVDAWNKYVEEIGAPQETRVSVAEIHNLRDGYSAIARSLWSRGSQTVWTMPNISALGPDEKVVPMVVALWSRSGWYGIWQTCSTIFGAPASA